MSDAINPDHYKRLPAEAIEIIEAAIDNAPSNQDAYLHGQVLKYILRCWHKNGIEDLKKAKWYLNRLVDSLDEYEQQKASDLQSLKDHPFGKLKQPAWTPNVGDWVKIKKPESWISTAWMQGMDKYDGKIVQVEEFDGRAIVHDEWCFLFDWLEPADQPKPTVEVAVEVTGEVKNPLGCPDGWRFLEVGEVIRKGDRFWYEGAWHDRHEDLIGWKYSVHHCQSIRRNRFEVGEKVVYIPDQSVWTYISEINDGPNHPKSAHVASGSTSLRVCVTRLAPYIEEIKPTVEVTGEVAGEVKPPDGWRWLEVGEILRRFDATFNSNGLLYELNQEKAGRTVTAPNVFIRRNRFEVGEKVVRVVNGVVYKVIRVLSMGYQLESEFCAEVILHGKDLAPYIEDAK